MNKLLVRLYHKKYILASILLLSAVSILLLAKFNYLVNASFGTWGDSSLIHACKNSRGGIAIVGSTDTCNQNETEETWVRDVDAGTGLTATRDSSGVTLSLANSNNSGWVEADETWTYGSADSPTFTLTISGDKTGKYSPGMRVKLTQTTEKYFIITAVAFSSPNTTVTVYGGTDYTLVNATITTPYYSTVKAPHGFPLDPTKWTVETTYSSNGNQGSPTQNTWYNIGSLSIDVPIGSWRLVYSTLYGFDSSTVGGYTVYVTLSTSNNSESDVTMTSGMYKSNSTIVTSRGDNERFLSVTGKTTYYMNVRTTSSGLNFIYMGNTLSPTSIKAISSYL